MRPKAGELILHDYKSAKYAVVCVSSGFGSQQLG